MAKLIRVWVQIDMRNTERDVGEPISYCRPMRMPALPSVGTEIVVKGCDDVVLKVGLVIYIEQFKAYVVKCKQEGKRHGRWDDRGWLPASAYMVLADKTLRFMTKRKRSKGKNHGV